MGDIPFKVQANRLPSIKLEDPIYLLLTQNSELVAPSNRQNYLFSPLNNQTRDVLLVMVIPMICYIGGMVFFYIIQRIVEDDLSTYGSFNQHIEFDITYK